MLARRRIHLQRFRFILQGSQSLLHGNSWPIRKFVLGLSLIVFWGAKGVKKACQWLHERET